MQVCDKFTFSPVDLAYLPLRAANAFPEVFGSSPLIMPRYRDRDMNCAEFANSLRSYERGIVLQIASLLGVRTVDLTVGELRDRWEVYVDCACAALEGV